MNNTAPTSSVGFLLELEVGMERYENGSMFEQVEENPVEDNTSEQFGNTEMLLLNIVIILALIFMALI